MSDVALSSQVATIRARLLSLAELHRSGRLDDASYEAARREAERALSEAIVATPSPDRTAAASGNASGVVSGAGRVAATRPSRRMLATVAFVVAAIAVAGYAFTGSPSLAGLGVSSSPPATNGVATAGGGRGAGTRGESTGGAAGDERELGLQQIAAMVDQLAEGWTMLARSYTVLTRYREALPAYRRAAALQPNDASLLADWADAIAAANGGKANAESSALLDRALAIDPLQPKALALAGTNAFDRGDFPAAVAQWQKIADALPPTSEFHQQVIANIDEARRRGGMPASSMVASTASSSATRPSSPGASPSSPATASAGSGHEALTGVVTLAPSVAAQTAPTDTVFVLARAEGGRMPLAVFRATVKDLPLRFRLDDSMAMTPTMKISDMKQVVVAARVSKSGNAISQPGDLSGESKPVAPGTNDLQIDIGTVVR